MLGLTAVNETIVLKGKVLVGKPWAGWGRQAIRSHCEECTPSDLCVVPIMILHMQPEGVRPWSLCSDPPMFPSNPE